MLPNYAEIHNCLSTVQTASLMNVLNMYKENSKPQLNHLPYTINLSRIMNFFCDNYYNTQISFCDGQINGIVRMPNYISDISFVQYIIDVIVERLYRFIMSSFNKYIFTNSELAYLIRFYPGGYRYHFTYLYQVVNENAMNTIISCVICRLREGIYNYCVYTIKNIFNDSKFNVFKEKEPEIYVDDDCDPEYIYPDSDLTIIKKYLKFLNSGQDNDDIDKLTYTNIRMLYASNISWAIPTVEIIEKIVAFSNPGTILEICSGNGFWAGLLRLFGAKVIASDFVINVSKAFIPDIYKLDAVSAVKKYPTRTLMICWPGLNETYAFNALKEFEGEQLIYIGEQKSGCTANDQFFELLESSWNCVQTHNMQSWCDISYDQLYLYERKIELPIEDINIKENINVKEDKNVPKEEEWQIVKKSKKASKKR